MKHQKVLTLVIYLSTFLPFSASAQWGDSYLLESKNKATEGASKPQKDQDKGASLVDSVKTKSTNAKIAILTDLSQSATGASESQKKIGNGRLGVSFLTERFYGDFSFSVFSSDHSKATGLVTDTSFFYNTLLLAQNQTGGLSEFSGNIGVNRLLNWGKPSENHRWRDKFGLHTYFRFSNQYWAKDSVYVDLSLNAFSVLLSYKLFDFRIESESWDHMQFFVYSGFTTRRLGGDYALDKNKAIREYFLGTDKYVFNSWEYGARLELGPFYGQAFFTEFKKSDNIAGFSGPQLAIKVGARIKLDIAATYN